MERTEMKKTILILVCATGLNACVTTPGTYRSDCGFDCASAPTFGGGLASPHGGAQMYGSRTPVDFSDELAELMMGVLIVGTAVLVVDAIRSADDDLYKGIDSAWLESVTVAGVTTRDEEPMAGMMADLMLGRELLATDRTDGDGGYTVRSMVEPGDCENLRIRLRHPRQSPGERSHTAHPVACGDNRVSYDYASGMWGVASR